MNSPAAYRARPFRYDALSHRVWICGQRCHHGATGTLVAAIACVQLPVAWTRPGRRAPSVLALAAGGALMAHDWKDRAIWFKLGPGAQD